MQTFAEHFAERFPLKEGYRELKFGDSLVSITNRISLSVRSAEKWHSPLSIVLVGKIRVPSVRFMIKI